MTLQPSEMLPAGMVVAMDKGSNSSHINTSHLNTMHGVRDEALGVDGVARGVVGGAPGALRRRRLGDEDDEVAVLDDVRGVGAEAEVKRGT